VSRIPGAIHIPSLDEALDRRSEWDLLPPRQAKFHDNRDEYPESKFIHPDGREAVFDGITGQLVTDERYMGTYNYINPAPEPRSFFDVGGAVAYIGRGMGHIVVDVVPYLIGGNVRGAN